MVLGFLKRNNLDYLEKTRNIKRLLILMRDGKDFQKRLEAAVRLGNLGDPVAFEPLLQLFVDACEERKLFVDDRKEETRRTIAEALVKVHRQKTVAFCLAEVQKGSGFVAQTRACIWALGDRPGNYV